MKVNCSSTEYPGILWSKRNVRCTWVKSTASDHRFERNEMQLTNMREQIKVSEYVNKAGVK